MHIFKKKYLIFVFGIIVYIPNLAYSSNQYTSIQFTDYLPYSVGSWWNYRDNPFSSTKRRVVSLKQDDPNTVVMKQTTSIQLPGAKLVAVNLTAHISDDGLTLRDIVYDRSKQYSNGEWLSQNISKMIAQSFPEGCGFPEVLSVGESSTCILKAIQGNSVKPAKIITQLLGFEDVTTPAGVFRKCIKIRRSIVNVNSAEKKDDHLFIWLAKGVGEVMSCNNGSLDSRGDCTQLVSYHIGNGTAW